MYLQPDLIGTSQSRPNILNRIAAGQFRCLFRASETETLAEHLANYERNWFVLRKLATVKKVSGRYGEAYAVLSPTEAGIAALEATERGFVWNNEESRIDLAETENFYRMWISKLHFLRGSENEDQRRVLFDKLHGFSDGPLAHLRQEAALAILGAD